jgi:hypothetical protein
MTYRGVIELDGTAVSRWQAQKWLYQHARADDYAWLPSDQDHGCRIVFWDQDLEVWFQLAVLSGA